MRRWGTIALSVLVLVTVIVPIDARAMEKTGSAGGEQGEVPTGGSDGDARDDRIPTIRTFAMPTDINPAGTIFGGWLMTQMDIAAGSVAKRVARGRVATVAVESIHFMKPVQVGDEVSFYANLVRIGTTSMTIHVEGWRRPGDSDRREMATTATFVFVALDENGEPRPVRPSDSETE